MQVFLSRLSNSTHAHEVITTVPLSLPFTRRVTAAIDNLEPSGQKRRRLSPKQDFRSHRSPLPNLECGRRSAAKLRRAIWPAFRGPPSLARITRKEGRSRVSLRVRVHIGPQLIGGGLCTMECIYRGANKGLHVLLSRTQAGPDRTAKHEQEEISRNHVQTFIPGSV